MSNLTAGISVQEFFLGENSRNSTKILLCGRILVGITEQIFFLGGIPVSTDFSAGLLPRYAAGSFPGKDPAGKTGHLGGIPAGSREVPGILAGSRYLFYKGKCDSCRRRQCPVCEQRMADLPVDRLTPDQPTFTSVCVDYVGPF